MFENPNDYKLKKPFPPAKGKYIDWRNVFAYNYKNHFLQENTLKNLRDDEKKNMELTRPKLYRYRRKTLPISSSFLGIRNSHENGCQPRSKIDKDRAAGK